MDKDRTEWTVVMFLGLALISGVGAFARSGMRIPSWKKTAGRWPLSARRHAQGAVEPDRLAVQHRVLHDVHRERRELGGVAEPLREGDCLAELIPHFLRQRAQQGRIERSRRDRVDADPAA